MQKGKKNGDSWVVSAGPRGKEKKRKLGQLRFWPRSIVKLSYISKPL
jgi:hypothetical protein